MSEQEEKQTGTVADAGKVFHEGKLTTYVSGLKYLGKDDLLSPYPYYDDEWHHTYHPDIESYSEEEYLSNPEKYVAKIDELNYIYKLKLVSETRYLEPYVTRMSLIHNPIFDDPNSKIELKGSPPLESYRMIFLNDEDTKTE